MAILPWKTQHSAPILMVAVLLLAIAFAIGHHAFYQHLNGQPTEDTSYLKTRAAALSHVSDQQINVSIGTFFAFLVKALLGAAVSVAFDQFAWKSVKAKATNIATIDNLFSVLSNGFVAFNLRLWRQHPISMLLACIIWLLPVASMISPATLNVQLATFSNSTAMQIPRIDFASINFAQLGSSKSPLPMVFYLNPMDVTQQIVSATAAQGEILTIQPPSVNSSWGLDFHGPALSCKNVSPSLEAAIRQDMITDIRNGSIEINDPKTSFIDSIVYVAWTPSDTSIHGSLPFSRNVTDTDSQTLGPSGPYEYITESQTTPADAPSLSFFISTVPHPVDNQNATIESAQNAARSATTIQCSLYNASYHTDFNYTNGEQTVLVSPSQYLNNVPRLYTISDNQYSHAMSNGTFVERLAYQSVMDAFASIIVGSVKLYIINGMTGSPDQVASGQIRTANTSIMSTALSNTKELEPIREAQMRQIADNTFQDFWGPRSITRSTNSSAILSESIEEMFRNITISLMSSSLLQPNYTANQLPDVNVTMSSDRTIYNYSVSILWTAYGIAIGVTLISTVLGMLAFRLNHGSYSTKFSTFFRAMQYASVSTELKPEDCSGEDPLPEYIAAAEISLHSQHAVKEEVMSEEHLERVESAGLIEEGRLEDNTVSSGRDSQSIIELESIHHRTARSGENGAL